MAQNLIFSRAAGDNVLSVEDIRFRAPAVFADTKAPRLTDRYESLHTSDLIPVLADYGYHPVQAAQKRAIKGSTVAAEHKAHMIAFAKPGDNDTGDTRSEIILYNSHDGTGSVKLFAGAYRFICSNGIVAGNGLSRSVYHTKKSLTDFEQMLRGIIESLPQVLARFDAARNIQTTKEQRYDMAKAAVMKRWSYNDAIIDVDGNPIAKGTYANEGTVNDVLGAHRLQDTLNDAFTVWNRIQENVLRGNAMVRSITENNVGLRKARPVTAVKEHLRINSELFELLPA